MRRREFIAGLGGAMASPLVAVAQQPALPAVGFVHSGSADLLEAGLRTFRQGLGLTGYVEAGT